MTLDISTRVRLKPGAHRRGFTPGTIYTVSSYDDDNDGMVRDDNYERRFAEIFGVLAAEFEVVQDEPAPAPAAPPRAVDPELALVDEINDLLRSRRTPNIYPPSVVRILAAYWSGNA